MKHVFCGKQDTECKPARYGEVLHLQRPPYSSARFAHQEDFELLTPFKGDAKKGTEMPRVLTPPPSPPLPSKPAANQILPHTWLGACSALEEDLPSDRGCALRHSCVWFRFGSV